MPTLKDYREAHYTNTAKVSDNVRTLAVAAIGLIWLFNKQIDGSFQVPNALLVPTILALTALALDFVQYLYGSIVWYFVFRYKESRNTKEDEEFKVANAFNYPTYAFFYLKVFALAFAYFYLLEFLYNQIKRV